MKTKLALISLILLSISGAASATTVYIESNLPNQNSLMGFELGAKGQLRSLGSVPTQGRGVIDPSFALGPFDSDQEIIATRDGAYILAVNSGSNTITVFCRNRDGTLMQVSGSPFASHGINPVSLGIKGNLLTVVNQHGDPAQSADPSKPNYTTFILESSGRLRWTGKNFELPAGASPSQALYSPFAPILFDANFLGGTLRSLQVQSNGTLTSSSAQTLPATEFSDPSTPKFPLGLAAHPRTPLVYVGFPTANKIGVYKYSREGKLEFVRAIKDSGEVVCWLTTNRAGTRLYASNTGDSSVTVYDIASDPSTPREIQKIALPSAGGTYQLGLSPDERHLVVLNQRFKAETPRGKGNELHSLLVEPRSGMLQIAPGSPFVLQLPGDVRPQGVLVL